jgi:hypothetical protein
MEPSAVITPPAALNTGNWAGYEWNGGSVAASVFTVPEFPYKDMSAAERNNQTVLSLWAGLGVSPYIEQIGIYDYVQAGKVNWAGVCAFWPTVNESCGHGISTGDKIAVSVHRSGLTYTLAMRDYGPHNVWAIHVSRTLNHVDTTAEVIVEDSTYPGYPLENLTYFSPVRAATSGTPQTEVYSPWGRAVKNAKRLITILHR